MTLQIDFWQLLGLLLSGLGALWGVVKMAAAQAQRHQDAAHAQLVTRLESIEQASRAEAGNWQLFGNFNARNATVAYTELEWE